MIGRLLSYPYGCVRSRALATRLLSSQTLASLAESPSCTEAAAMLGSLLPAKGREEPAEVRLLFDYIEWGRLILRTLPLPAADLFHAYLRRNWVENLLALCRSLLTEDPGVKRPRLLPTLDSSSLPDPASLDGIDALAARLTKGPYREVLVAFSKALPKEGLSLLENRLCQRYWQEVEDAAQRLAPLDRGAAKELLGLRADIDALRVLHRGQTAALSWAQVWECWPPLARLDAPERLRLRFRAGGTVTEMLPSLRRFSIPEGQDIEAVLRRRLHRELRSHLVSAPFDISVPLSLLLLKELEVLDLQGILAGLSYGLAPRDILPFVSGQKEV